MTFFKHAKSSKFNCALMLALINTKLSSGETNFGKSKVSLIVDKNPTDIIDENIVKNMNNLNLLLNNNRKLVLEGEISPLLSENRLKNYNFPSHLIDNDKTKSERNLNPLYRQCNSINKEIDEKNDEKHYQEIEEPLMINTEASSTTDHCEMPIMDIIVAPLSGKETLHEEKSLLTETERPLINENLNHYNLKTFPLVALFRHEESIKDTSKRNASLVDEGLSNNQNMLPPNEVKLKQTHEDRMPQMKTEKLRKTDEKNLIIDDEIRVLKDSMLPEDRITSEQMQTFDKLQTQKLSDDKEPKIEGKYPQIDDEINLFIGPKMLPQKDKIKSESVQTEIPLLTAKVKRKYPQIDDDIIVDLDEMINGLIEPKVQPEEYRIQSEQMQINDKLQTAKLKRIDDKEPKIERKYPQIDDEINGLIGPKMLPEEYRIKSEQMQIVHKLQTPKVKTSDDKEPKIETKYPQIDDEINLFIGPKMLPQKNKIKSESLQTEITLLTAKVKRKYPQIDDEIINGLIEPKVLPEEYRKKSEQKQINDKIQTGKVKRSDDKEPKIERKYPQIDDEINGLIGPKMLPEEYRIKSEQMQINDKLQAAKVKRSDDKEPKMETKYPQIDDKINDFIGPKMLVQDKVTLKPVQTEDTTLLTAKIKRSDDIDFKIERKYVRIEDEINIPITPKMLQKGTTLQTGNVKIYYKQPEIEKKYVLIDGQDLFNGTTILKKAKILANKEQTQLIVAGMPKIETGKAKIIEVFKTGVNDGLIKKGNLPQDELISPKSVLLRKRATDSQTDSEIAILDVFLTDEDDREMSQDDDTLASIRKEYFMARSHDHIQGSELENGRTIPIIRANKSLFAILKNDSNNEKKMFFKDFQTMSFMSAAANQAERNFNTSSPQNYSKLTSILNEVYLRSEINNPYRIGINDLELLQNRRETPDFYNDNDFYTLPFDEIGTPLQEIERRLGNEREWHLTQDDFRSIKRQLGRSNEIKGNMEYAVNDSVEAIQSKIDEVKTIVRDFYRINAAINENMCNPIPYLILLTVVVIINAV